MTSADLVRAIRSRSEKEFKLLLSKSQEQQPAGRLRSVLQGLPCTRETSTADASLSEGASAQCV